MIKIAKLIPDTMRVEAGLPRAGFVRHNSHMKNEWGEPGKKIGERKKMGKATAWPMGKISAEVGPRYGGAE
jgi:hypothetical protein